MRVREVARPVFDPPPLELRRWSWTGPRPQPAGESVGGEVYGSHGEWLAARRVWEAGRGVTVRQWYAAALAEALAEHGFDKAWPEMQLYRPDRDEEEPDCW